MTEEERKREVERISRKTQKSVKTPSNEQRIICIVRFKAGNLASYIGTLEEAPEKQKRWNACTVRSNILNKKRLM